VCLAATLGRYAVLVMSFGGDGVTVGTRDIQAVCVGRSGLDTFHVATGKTLDPVATRREVLRRIGEEPISEGMTVSTVLSDAVAVVEVPRGRVFSETQMISVTRSARAVR
jgi:hypothetical protein